MKQIITTVAILFCLGPLYSQSNLDFCTSVEKNGYCVFNNNKFFFSPDSTTAKIYMEIRDTATFKGTAKITFKIYTVDKKGEEKYSSMIEQPVQDDWVFAWLPHVFEAAGKYNVKIFNDKDELMCSRGLELYP